MTGARIGIDLSRQTLTLFVGSQIESRYSISSALKGAGEQVNSGCTPRGLHRIRAKVGAGCPLGSVFIGRRPTGEQYSAELAEQYPQRDWILSRILWLCGCEPGVNRLADRDTMRRYIYIHGTPDSEPMGQPLSHGCIRMRNRDLIALFERVSCGTFVQIDEVQTDESS
ncbi:MAG: L,D-transpeptidase [Motiliproteus sp.]